MPYRERVGLGVVEVEGGAVGLERPGEHRHRGVEVRAGAAAGLREGGFGRGGGGLGGRFVGGGRHGARAPLGERGARILAEGPPVVIRKKAGGKRPGKARPSGLRAAPRAGRG